MAYPSPAVLSFRTTRHPRYTQDPDNLSPADTRTPVQVQTGTLLPALRMSLRGQFMTCSSVKAEW